MDRWVPYTEPELAALAAGGLTDKLIAEIRRYRAAAKGSMVLLDAARVKAEGLERENVIAQAILQSAPKPWLTDSNYSGPEWMAEYRKWWIRRLPGTAELLDEATAATQPRVAELERENERLRGKIVAYHNRIDDDTESINKLCFIIGDLTAQLAAMTKERDDRIAELGRVYSLVDRWAGESRKFETQLAERDRAISAAPHEMMCPTQPCSGRFGAPCNCWKSRALSAIPEAGK